MHNYPYNANEINEKKMCGKWVGMPGHGKWRKGFKVDLFK